MEAKLLFKEPAGQSLKTPLLFVHGMWHGGWCWEEFFMPYFTEKGFPVYVLNLLGHGTESSKEKLRWLSIDNYVQDVYWAVEKIGRPLVAISHSMGGRIVQKYLKTHPLLGAVFLAPVPLSGVLSATMRILMRHPAAVFQSVATLNLTHVIAHRNWVREWFFSAGLAQNKLERYFKRLQNESFRAFLDLLIPIRPNTQLYQTPLFFIGGGADALISVREIEKSARALQAPAEIFADSPHDMMLDENWREVAGRILEWLQQLKA